MYIVYWTGDFAWAWNSNSPNQYAINIDEYNKNNAIVNLHVDTAVDNLPLKRADAIPKQIVNRGLVEVQNCDLLVVSFLGLSKTSIDMCIKCAWAYQLRKPIMAIIEKQGFANIHDNEVLRTMFNYTVANYNEAWDIINDIYKGGVRSVKEYENNEYR